MRKATFIASTLSCLASLSYAQEQSSQPPASGGPGLREVIVTAEKVAESAQRVPLSLTVIDQRALQDMGAVHFTDYASTVPALSFESLAPGEQRILLRGVSDGVSTALRGVAQNVTGVYIDDMVVSNNYTSPDLNLFDVNRVEVLKGPQGTLYGDGSVGGLVRVITNRANASRFESEVELTGAAIAKGGGDYAANGMVNLPIVADKAGLRLVGQYSHNDGYIDEVNLGNRSNHNDEYGTRASLRLMLIENFSVTLNALSQHIRLGGYNNYNPQVGDLKDDHLFPNSKDTTFDLFNATLQWDLPSVSLLSSTSYDKFRRIDAEDATYPVSSAFAPFLLTLLPSSSAQSQTSHAVSQEFRLTSAQDRRLRWIGGLYYFKATERDTEIDPSVGFFDLYNSSIGPALGLPVPIQGSFLDAGQDVVFAGVDNTQRTEYAAFGEVTFDLTRTIAGTVGVRYFDDKLADAESAAGFATFNTPYFIVESTRHHGKVLKFRLQDQITPDFLLYATASQGYRVGGLNPLSPANIANPNAPLAFAPDSLWNYELGWKTQLADRRITLDGALYYINWTNIQVEYALPNGFSGIANAGLAHIAGAEAEVAARPFNGVEVGLSGSLIGAKLGRDSPAIGGKKDDQLTGVPKGQGSAYAQFSFPAYGSFIGFVRGDVEYTALIRRYFASDTSVNVGTTPNYALDHYGDYALLNLHTGIDNDDWRAVFFIKNVADRRARYFSDTTGGTFATGAPFSHEDIYLAQPRTVGVTISKRF